MKREIVKLCCGNRVPVTFGGCSKHPGNWGWECPDCRAYAIADRSSYESWAAGEHSLSTFRWKDELPVEAEPEPEPEPYDLEGVRQKARLGHSIHATHVLKVFDALDVAERAIRHVQEAKSDAIKRNAQRLKDMKGLIARMRETDRRLREGLAELRAKYEPEEAFTFPPFPRSDLAASKALEPILKHVGISPKGPWLAGGAVRRACVGEDPNAADWDIFCRFPAQAVAVRQSLSEACASGQPIRCYGYDTKDQPQVSGELHDYGHEYTMKDGMKIQVIDFELYESPEKLINLFDFTACQFAWDGEKIYRTKEARADAMDKRIRIHEPGVRRLWLVVWHMLKYVRGGYMPGREDVLFLAQRLVEEEGKKEKPVSAEWPVLVAILAVVATLMLAALWAGCV